MKKVLSVVLIVIMLMAISCTALAEGPSRLEMITLKSMVAGANATIWSLVRIAQKTPYDDVQWLLWSVDAVVAPVKAYANRIGAQVVCDYDYYVIDGRSVAVDPLRVINPL